MKLSIKMYLGFAIPAFVLIGVGTYALYSFRIMNQQLGTIYDDRVVPLTQLKVISDQYAVNIIDAVNKTDAGLISMTQTLQMIEAAEQATQENWQAYLKTELTIEEKKLVDEVQALFTPVNREIASLKRALQSQDLVRVKAFNGPLYQVIDPLTIKVQELTNL
ncbi:MAG: MCP four helix bundle domain-containing protein, partial [Leptolyngbyaceae bacterium]|nr:MCP four helix bundle domain-containing protein [Leptolyngbyaceae bacterium]